MGKSSNKQLSPDLIHYMRSLSVGNGVARLVVVSVFVASAIVFLLSDV